jgi:hypothetical protein
MVGIIVYMTYTFAAHAVTMPYSSDERRFLFYQPANPARVQGTGLQDNVFEIAGLQEFKEKVRYTYKLPTDVELHIVFTVLFNAPTAMDGITTLRKCTKLHDEHVIMYTDNGIPCLITNKFVYAWFIDAEVMLAVHITHFQPTVVPKNVRTLFWKDHDKCMYTKEAKAENSQEVEQEIALMRAELQYKSKYPRNNEVITRLAKLREIEEASGNISPISQPSNSNSNSNSNSSMSGYSSAT